MMSVNIYKNTFKYPLIDMVPSISGFCEVTFETFWVFHWFTTF